jgi:hypothetical protein
MLDHCTEFDQFFRDLLLGNRAKGSLVDGFNHLFESIFVLYLREEVLNDPS